MLITEIMTFVNNRSFTRLSLIILNKRKIKSNRSQHDTYFQIYVASDVLIIIAISISSWYINIQIYDYFKTATDILSYYSFFKTGMLNLHFSIRVAKQHITVMAAVSVSGCHLSRRFNPRELSC